MTQRCEKISTFSAGLVAALPRCVSHCTLSQLDDAMNEPPFTSNHLFSVAIERVKGLEHDADQGGIGLSTDKTRPAPARIKPD